MSAISLKSITGITSITTPAGVDNQLTLHTNNTVERLRIASDGNVGVNTSSVSIAGMSRYLSVSARNVTNGGAAVELVGARTGSDQSLGVINFVNQTSNVAEIRAKYQGSTTLGSLHFQTSGTERLQITSTGDLSLRSTTQNAFLGLTANSNAINFTLGSTTGTYPRAYFYGTGNGQSTAGDIFMGTGVGGDLRLRSGGAIKLQTNSDNSTIDAFFIHAAGTVAVNTFIPDTTYRLDVAGAGQFTTSTTNQQNDFLTGQLTVRNNQAAQGAFIDFRADSATGVQGVIAKIGGTTKSFVIDHPTKENHKLQYACLEGPENSVYVRGRSSDPVIELPDYWVGLVHEDSITVNVTPIGNKNVWVESINNNSVTIGTDGSTEYFYTVFAERKDVEKLEVEVQK